MHRVPGDYTFFKSISYANSRKWRGIDVTYRIIVKIKGVHASCYIRDLSRYFNIAMIGNKKYCKTAVNVLQP
jgi:hypothetical protein